jgi:CheY-like chemotaxis protein
MDAVGRLAGGVAHDFNNMLGAILGHVELACDHMGTDHPARADLDEIRSAAERSAALTRQLLAFARKQTIAPRLLDLNEAIEAVLKMLRRLIGENVRLTWSPGSGLGPVRMDPSQVDQILANLCINARDAIEGSGTVVIETRAVTLGAAECRGRPGFVPGDYVVLEVRDDGCGMDRFTLEHLFEPFFTTKVHGRGTGLGLATVYGIVRQNHGLIDLASEPGAGTTFHVYLPVEEGVVPGAVEPERSAPPRGRGETLLLVEDEEALRVTFARYLEARGYRVLSADEPVAALALSSEHAGEIRLLVTDVVLPGMNGVELAERLSAKRPGLSVLYVSGYSSDAIAGSGVLAPDVQFLEKPFSLATLAARVHEMLR